MRDVETVPCVAATCNTCGVVRLHSALFLNQA